MAILFHGAAAGEIADATEFQANFDLVENSFLDIGPFVVTGLVPSAGSGLAVNVSTGTALIGGRVTVSSTLVIGSLAPSTTNHLYLNQNGSGTSNTTGTQPANTVKLGTATTGASSVSSVDTSTASGRQTKVSETDTARLSTSNAFTSEPHTFSSVPTASTQRGVVNLGSGGFTGGGGHFAGSASGTLLAMNSAGAFAGNLLDLQVGGSARFSVSAGGVGLMTGDFKVTGSYKGSSNPVRFALNTTTPGSDADVTISGANAEALFQRLETGSWTTARNVVLPTTVGALYVVHNNTTFNATFKTSAGTGVTVATLKYAWIWCGGANYIRLTPDT